MGLQKQKLTLLWGDLGVNRDTEHGRQKTVWHRTEEAQRLKRRGNQEQGQTSRVGKTPEGGKLPET